MSKGEIDSKIGLRRDFLRIADEKKLYLPDNRCLTDEWIRLWFTEEKDFLSRIGLTQLNYHQSNYVEDSLGYVMFANMKADPKLNRYLSSDPNNQPNYD